MAKIDQLLQIVKEIDTSDLHLAVGSVPVIRVKGDLDAPTVSKGWRGLA